MNEAPGFVVNKILIPMINEAIGLVETGVATRGGHRQGHAAAAPTIPWAPWPWAT